MILLPNKIYTRLLKLLEIFGLLTHQWLTRWIKLGLRWMRICIGLLVNCWSFVAFVIRHFPLWCLKGNWKWQLWSVLESNYTRALIQRDEERLQRYLWDLRILLQSKSTRFQWQYWLTKGTWNVNITLWLH